MHHPLQKALAEKGVTQQWLADEVSALRWKRDNGSPLRLKQESVSRICKFKRRVMPDIARAIAHVMENVSAAELVMATPHRKRSAA